MERTYCKYLKEWQPGLEIFPAQNHFYQYYNRSILHKVIYRAGLSGIIGRINKELRTVIERTRPTAVLVFKGMEVLPETLEWMQARNIFLANFNPDNPFIFSGYGSGNANVTRSIPLYDLHFTYNLEIKARLEKDHRVDTAFLPFGFDAGDDLYEVCRGQEEICKVCFLGNPDKERVAVLEALLDKGIEIDVYGHHWDTFIRHRNLQIKDAVYEDEFWKVLSRYRVQLNLMRVHNERSHNMRTFEIPGIGGIQLAPDTPEHRLFFEPGKEIFLFNDAAEGHDAISRLLSLSPAAAAEIRLAARKRSIDSDYTYKGRARQAFAAIEQGMEKKKL